MKVAIKLILWLTPFEAASKKQTSARHAAVQLCSLRDFDTFGNLARTYAVHNDGAAFDVKTADNGGGVNQNICNVGVMRVGRPIKTESGVVDN